MRMTVVFCALPLGLAGCSQGDARMPEPLSVVPARGVVTYRGQPVRDAAVSFQSLDGKVSASGTTDGVGSFVLSTYGQEDGAPPGRYKVVVAADTAREIEPGVLEPEPEGGWKSPIPVKYANPDTTDVLVEITLGGENNFKIVLK
jgi:hypothetical protein